MIRCCYKNLEAFENSPPLLGTKLFIRGEEFIMEPETLNAPRSCVALKDGSVHTFPEFAFPLTIDMQAP